ncbi:MAG: ClcB-like voltage-gated chloride channel protein [Burkholderiales bacterium]|nr:ClcB-like voltage-gated chloride channel protein [Burkholderiales bacterium]
MKLLFTRLWLLERLKPGEQQRTLWAAALIGFLGALATVGFRELISAAEILLYGQHGSLVKAAQSLPYWARIVVPCVGGALAGLLLSAGRRQQGEGLASDYMEAISLKDRSLGIGHSLIRAASSWLSVVSGSSIGREGAMVQLAAVTGTWFGNWRQLSPPRKRLMVACGAAAGITAAYNAPIAGALFIAEIVLRSIAIETLGPLIVSSVISNLTIHALFDYGPVYAMPEFRMLHLPEIGLHGALGLIMGVAAPLFLQVLDQTKKAFARLALPLPAKLALGGALVGLISVWRPEVWGNGYSVVNEILADQWPVGLLAIVLLSKVVATALTTGSGAVGGVFTPTLFVGAALGSIFGTGCHLIWPDIAPAPVYAATGMAAMLAATTFAPLMAILMIFEMTGNYQIMLPLMIASVLAYSLARLRRDRSVYSGSLGEAGKSFPGMQVKDIRRDDPPTLPHTARVGEFEHSFVHRRWQHIYVVDEQGRFLGAVSLHDIGPALRAGQLPADQVLPAEWIKRDYPRVTPEMSLAQALESFSRHPGERLPVVGATGALMGYITKNELVLLLQESFATP